MEQLGENREHKRLPRRDAEATRRRVLHAATMEFSRYGFSGARIERIANAARTSKPMIYVHFEDKEGLFAAVVSREFERVIELLPLDPDDLPGYAADVFDRTVPGKETAERVCLRLNLWYRLELDQIAEARRRPAHWATLQLKAANIEAAQKAGKLPDDIPAMHLLLMVTSMATAWAFDAAAHQDGTARESLKAAVRKLIARPA